MVASGFGTGVRPICSDVTFPWRALKPTIATPVDPRKIPHGLMTEAPGKSAGMTSAIAPAKPNIAPSFGTHDGPSDGIVENSGYASPGDLDHYSIGDRTYTTSAGVPGASFTAYATTNYYRSDLTFRRGNGKPSVPSDAANGNWLGTISAQGLISNNWASGASLLFDVDGAMPPPGTNLIPAAFSFQNSDGTNGITERIRIRWDEMRVLQQIQIYGGYPLLWNSIAGIYPNGSGLKIRDQNDTTDKSIWAADGTFSGTISAPLLELVALETGTLTTTNGINFLTTNAVPANTNAAKWVKIKIEGVDYAIPASILPP